MAHLLVPRFPDTSCFKIGDPEKVAASCTAILTDHYDDVVYKCHSDVYRFLLDEEGTATDLQRKWAIRQVREAVFEPQFEKYLELLAGSVDQVCSDRSLFGRLSLESRRVLKNAFISKTMTVSDRKAVVQVLVEARELLQRDAAKEREDRAARQVDDDDIVLPSKPQPAGGRGNVDRKRAKREKDRELRGRMNGLSVGHGRRNSS